MKKFLLNGRSRLTTLNRLHRDVYGLDKKQNGLVDVLGGLEMTINIAKERAGILKGYDITL
ncbi:MAG: hypothetical protein ABR936_06150 [Bacteroidota bacterium]